jgi:hypothetical protein
MINNLKNNLKLEQGREPICEGRRRRKNELSSIWADKSLIPFEVRH